MRDKALKIYSHYGYKNQLKKLSEEVYEFIEAMLEYETGTGDIEHVIEELGDVEFILYQFREANEINTSEIRDVWRYKSKRQLTRIGNEKRNPLIKWLQWFKLKNK